MSSRERRAAVTELYAYAGLDPEAAALPQQSLTPRPRSMLMDEAALLRLGPGQLVRHAGCRDGRYAIPLVQQFGCRGGDGPGDRPSLTRGVRLPRGHSTRREMEIQPKQPTTKGPAEMFTGDVWYDVIARGQEPSRIRVNIVRFAPGARNAWHAHAVGQTLHVTEGRGLIQSRGGEVVEIRPGQTIYTPPGEWHWHGAAPDHFMSHLAMWEGPTRSSRRRRCTGGVGAVRAVAVDP